MSNILTMDQVIENAENPHFESKKFKFLLNAKASQSEIEKFLEVIGLHPQDLGFPKGKDLWSREKEDKFFSRILTSILPYEGEIEVEYGYLLSVYKDVSLSMNEEDEEDEEDEEEMDDLAMLKDVLNEAGWHSKSHELKEILKALIDGERICRLDSAADGEDDLLIGDAHDVDVDVCSHFEIEEIPDDWSVTDVTDYIKSRMW
jgi:hypothetical protein